MTKRKQKRKTSADPNEMVQYALGYAPDDLTVNRDGYLGDRQRKVLRRMRLDQGAAAFIFAALAVFTIWFGGAYFPGQMGIFWFCAAVMLIGAGIIGLRVNRLTDTLNRGEIATVEGRADLQILGAGTYAIRYELRVGSQRFPVSKEVFLSFRNGELYRVYYVPKSRTLLGAEVIEQEDPFEEREEANDVMEVEATLSHLSNEDHQEQRHS